MKRTKSQLSAIYCSYRDRAERRRNARKALYGWVSPADISYNVAFFLDRTIENGCAGEFVETIGGFQETRRNINWYAVCGRPRYNHHYIAFERYRAAVRAQKSPYYRRRLAKLGIDWKTVKRPYGTEAIELD